MGPFSLAFIENSKDRKTSRSARPLRTRFSSSIRRRKNPKVRTSGRGGGGMGLGEQGSRMNEKSGRRKVGAGGGGDRKTFYPCRCHRSRRIRSNFRYVSIVFFSVRLSLRRIIVIGNKEENNRGSLFIFLLRLSPGPERKSY